MGFDLQLNVPKIVTVGVVGVLCLVITMLLTHGFYLKFTQDEFVAKHKDYTNATLVKLNEQYAKNLHTYRWIDEKTGTVAIDLSQAVKVMSESKGKPPTTQPTNN